MTARYNGTRARQRKHEQLRREVAQTRLEKMIEQARASHRASLSARTDYEREALRSDARWWLDNARQEKDWTQ